MFSDKPLILPVWTKENKDLFVPTELYNPWTVGYSNGRLARPEHYSSYIGLDKPVHLDDICDIKGIPGWTKNHFIDLEAVSLSGLLFEVSSKHHTQMLEFSLHFWPDTNFKHVIEDTDEKVLKLDFRGKNIKRHMVCDSLGCALDVFRNSHPETYLHTTLDLELSPRNLEIKVKSYTARVDEDVHQLNVKLLGYRLYIPVDFKLLLVK